MIRKSFVFILLGFLQPDSRVRADAAHRRVPSGHRRFSHVSLTATAVIWALKPPK